MTMCEPTQENIEWARGLINAAKAYSVVTTEEGYRFVVDLDKKIVYIKPKSRKDGLENVVAAFKAIGFTMQDDQTDQDPDVDRLTNIATELLNIFVKVGVQFEIEIVKLENHSHPSLLMTHTVDKTRILFCRSDEGFWQVQHIKGEWIHSMGSTVPYDTEDTENIVLHLVSGARRLLSEEMKENYKYN
jgi:hypothetical protein